VHAVPFISSNDTGCTANLMNTCNVMWQQVRQLLNAVPAKYLIRRKWMKKEQSWTAVTEFTWNGSWPVNAAQPFALYVPRRSSLCVLLTGRRPPTRYTLVGPFGDAENIGTFKYSGNAWSLRGFSAQLLKECKLRRADFERFVADPRLQRWFTFMGVLDSPKIVSMPVGVQSKLLIRTAYRFAAMDGRSPLDNATKAGVVGVTFDTLGLSKNRGNYRKYVYDSLINASFTLTAPTKALLPGHTQGSTKADIPGYIARIAAHQFIPSPKGIWHGRDCYRTWAVLLLGGIPIVERRRMHHLYDHLPIVVVDSLVSDVNQKFLDSEWTRLHADDASKAFDFRKLFVPYYQELVRESLLLERSTGCATSHATAHINGLRGV
jgi:hypothetical protein